MLLKMDIKKLYWFMTDRSWRTQFLDNRARLSKYTKARKQVATKILETHSASIHNGPFAGMKYVPAFNGEYFTQKLIGFYEHELNEIIESICLTPYRLVIDIGAAEGYYACGLAFRKEDCRVICFEADRRKHSVIRQIARLNHVESQLTVQGFCDRESLSNVIKEESGRILLFLDCEGGELSLLDPIKLDKLLECDILVETHDFLIPGITETLTSRFSNSHHVFKITKRPFSSDLQEFAKNLGVSSHDLLLAADEMRPEANAWLWLQKR